MKGFTIICNRCGHKQLFEDDDKLRGDNIDIHVKLTGTYAQYFDYATVYCENIKCNQWIELF